ncbi:grasp-with-spasm system SPASM domain peptide maturase [Cellulophaga baltica]|uniref:SPASM domain peptide maturase, grasp-with-spasm system n=1 Tax=Cellulophaga baltica TaxID=76594 RepID=A0A1G7JMY9_9FLAO|nr:grasp-with-spasm system SPASM domain peptide maturase [Cellulophaga baltica]SDF26350.1 SPASM domain peptide maturase, grasp-with-spasm system [Cellulophaga baltica]
MSLNQSCLLYSNCIPVKGAKKSIVFDLQNQTFFNIPNDLYNILKDHRGKSIEEIKSVYDNKYDNIIDNYFKILIKNNVAFFTITPELFPEIKLNFFNPFEITNAIVDIGISSSYNINKVFLQLSELHCKYIQIRIFRDSDEKDLRSILNYFNEIKSNTIGLDLFIPYNEGLEELYHLLFEDYPRLNSIIVYSSPYKKNIIPKGHSKYLIYTSLSINSEKHCGLIDKSLFSINMKNFSEAQSFNSCLNGKISIDKNGEIKNCPSIQNSFGNINDISLKDTLKFPDFKKYWKTTKNQIDVCKDCEFRYVCTDCRAYTDRANFDGEIDLSKPLKCGYDPYTNEWQEWSNNPLKQDAIKYYNMQEFIKKDV